MLLLSDSEVEELRLNLATQTGFRVASIDVDFGAFDFARTGASFVDRAVAYSMPSGDRLVGIGTAWHTSASGPSRFAQIKEKLEAVGRPELRAFFGFSFLPEGPRSDLWSGFPSAEAFLARIGIEQSGDRTRLTVIVPETDELGPTLDLLASIRHPEWEPVVDLGDHAIESRPPITEWAKSVSDAVEVIERGDLEKVVLSRSVVVRSTKPVEILKVFRDLVRLYPQCYNFAWKSGDAVFMGASPELIAEVGGARLRSNPLAGSAARGVGEEEDRLIGHRLFTSAKDREEHALVVDDLAKRLAPWTDVLDVPVAPVLKAMETVQHLSTVIEGTLLDGVGILDVIDAVHPTPAVGGVERDAAVRYISNAEGMDRGWYTGGVGWINAEGDGAICIGLRCGLIRGERTHLYAGAGIVAGSKPEEEVSETRLKLRPLLDLLTAT